LAFTVSYNIKAIDEFSKTLKDIQKNFKDFNKQFEGGFSNINDASKMASKSLNDVKKKANESAKNINKMSNSFETRGVSKFQRMMVTVGNVSAVAGAKVKSAFSHLSTGGGIGSLLRGGSVVATAGAAGMKAGEFAQEKLRLSVMVKDQSTLNDAMNQMRSIAIATNKPMSEITDSFRLLLEQGNNATQALAKMKQQLDISAYTGIAAPEITRLFTKVQQSGRATNEILDSFNEKGLQLKGILAKMKGMKFETDWDKQAFDRLVASGAVTSQDLQKALKVWFDTHKEAVNMSEKMAKTGLGANVQRLISSFGDLFTSMFQALDNLIPITKAVGMLADGIEKAANWFRDLKDTHPIVSGLLSALVAVAGLRVAFGGIAIALRAITGLMGVGGILGGVKGLIGGVGRLVMRFTMLDIAVKGFGSIKGAITSLISPLSNVGKLALSAFNVIKNGAISAAETLGKGLMSIFERIPGVIGKALGAIGALWMGVSPKDVADSTMKNIDSMTKMYRDAHGKLVDASKAYNVLDLRQQDAQGVIQQATAANNIQGNPIQQAVNAPYSPPAYIQGSESTSNINLVVQSQNADVKSMQSETKGSRNINVGFNAYRI
jgi:hypothetical protein